MGPWLEFEALKGIEGPVYFQKRDEWIAAVGAGRDRLQERLKPDDWRDRVTAGIAIGWLEHRDLYEQVLRGLDQESPREAGRTVLGLNLIWDKYARLAERSLGPDILPLCWESVLNAETSGRIGRSSRWTG